MNAYDSPGGERRGCYGSRSRELVAMNDTLDAQTVKYVVDEFICDCYELFHLFHRLEQQTCIKIEKTRSKNYRSLLEPMTSD
jgi:hypothetical protein